MGKLLKTIFMYALGNTIARLVTGLGISVVTYQGLSAAIPPLLNGIVSSLNATSSEAVNIILLAGTGQALTIIGSAAIARATMVAATNAMGLGG